MKPDDDILAVLEEVKVQLNQLQKILVNESNTRNELWMKGEGKMFALLEQLLRKVESKA